MQRNLPSSVTFVSLSGLLLSLFGCTQSGTFNPANCPGTDFPKAKDLIQEIDIPNYSFYFTNIMSGTSLFKFETWADQKFEYDGSLNYYFENDNYLEKRCAKAIILRLKLPLTTTRESVLQRFITFVEKKSGKPLEKAINSAKSMGKLDNYIGIKRFDLNPSRLLEITGFHHPARGEFLEAGWYETPYYEENFAPQSADKTQSTSSKTGSK